MTTTVPSGEARLAPNPPREAFSLLQRRGAWKDALRRRLLVAADLVALLTATAPVALVDGPSAALLLAVTAPGWLLLAHLQGLYHEDHAKIRHLTAEETGRLFQWALLATVSSALLVSQFESIGRGAALALGFTAFGASFALRAAARALWRRFTPPERGLVIGTGELAQVFARKLVLERGHHVELVDFVDPQLLRDSVDDALDDRALRHLLHTERIERVVVAVADLDEEVLRPLVRLCRENGVKLSVAPPIRAMFGTAVSLGHLGEWPLVEYRTWDLSRTTLLAKRLFDVVLASIALVVLAPLLVVVGLVVRLTSPGPALFCQERAGLHGRPFTMLKFRTMVADAEARLAEVVAIDELAEPMFKLRQDPRITRVGWVLRRTSVDELPQLINVLKGDMTLVGPRPEQLSLVERYGESERFRLSVRPGLTGPMQVHGRGELTFQERLAVEREYVENYHYKKDIRILIQTVGVVIARHGAF